MVEMLSYIGVVLSIALALFILIGAMTSIYLTAGGANRAVSSMLSCINNGYDWYSYKTEEEHTARILVGDFFRRVLEECPDIGNDVGDAIRGWLFKEKYPVCGWQAEEVINTGNRKWIGVSIENLRTGAGLIIEEIIKRRLMTDTMKNFVFAHPSKNEDIVLFPLLKKYYKKWRRRKRKWGTYPIDTTTGRLVRERPEMMSSGRYLDERQQMMINSIMYI